ncbi:YjfB family protein [Sporanaerobacter acetigenes]|uniref:YjfB family protein n=1 Tax=Sporanaerobacter acetigenes TaxID=165813 RepID=UPI00332088CA
MDIVALSMGLSQMKVAQEASVSILKMAMDTAKGQSLDLAKMLEQSVNPHIGGNIDISI